VKVAVFSITGELVNILENEFKKSGSYKLTWNSKNKFGNSVASGIYFIQVKHNDKMLTKKIMLLK
jgi:flagellar hook assembly protein FlgD